MPDVKALLFDVFGTLVDWHSSIAREGQAILSPLGITLDWEGFADQHNRSAFCQLFNDERNFRWNYRQSDRLYH